MIDVTHNGHDRCPGFGVHGLLLRLLKESFRIVDLGALGVDFAVGGSVKWLCGGPGAGYLYVRPDLIERFQPSVVGWAGHDEPFAFETGGIRYASGIERFQSGTPNVPALASARAGYEIVAEIGVPAIREKSLRLTRRLMDAATQRGWRLNTPDRDEERGGSVVVDVPGAAVATDDRRIGGRTRRLPAATLG